MEPLFAGTAKVFVYLLYLKRARLVHVRYALLECGTSGQWHIHCAIELPSHLDAIALERLIRKCWAKVELGHRRILVRDCANAGWIDYMLKDRQKMLWGIPARA
jgi:hypothetical protein